MINLRGVHHVTAITSDAKKNYEFFTNIMGMRLVKKTINQDDIKTYHLFFADDIGSPGTDITFFDFKGIQKAVHANDEIARTSFRVPNDLAIDYWLKRLNHYNITNNGIEELFGHKIIYFNDFDDQLFAIISDEKNKGIESGIPWKKGPVPNEFAITGLGPIFLNVSSFEHMDPILTEVLNMRKTNQKDNVFLYEMGDGGNGGSLVVTYNENDPLSSLQGYGGIHHIAFRVKDVEQLDFWIDRLNKYQARNSGFVDRFYFKSLYTRMYPNFLFELATDGPGFIDDEEDYEILGETLALPPKFRNHREYVESVVKPFDTVRSTKTFEKEYF